MSVMNEFPALYTCSFNEARKRNRLDLWQISHFCTRLRMTLARFPPFRLVATPRELCYDEKTAFWCGIRTNEERFDDEQSTVFLY